MLHSSPLNHCYTLSLNYSLLLHTLPLNHSVLCYALYHPSKRAGSDSEAFWLRPACSQNRPGSYMPVVASRIRFGSVFSKEGLNPTVQNQPGYNLVQANCVRFWPNGSGPEASRCARIIRPASDLIRFGPGKFTGTDPRCAVTLSITEPRCAVLHSLSVNHTVLFYTLYHRTTLCCFTLSITEPRCAVLHSLPLNHAVLCYTLYH